VVIASQDDVGGESLSSIRMSAILTKPGAGLFIRPPYEDEKFANWEKSVAGLREEDNGWVYVPPVPNVHTVFLGKSFEKFRFQFGPNKSPQVI
jgi:hypothetical protein